MHIPPNPKVLLLDEPLSNIDAKLRVKMREERQKLNGVNVKIPAKEAIAKAADIGFTDVQAITSR